MSKATDPKPIVDLIRDAMDRRGVSTYALSARCGWSSPSICGNMLRGNPTARSLERMLGALGATVRVGGETLRLDLDADGQVVAERKSTPKR